jgi:hypothetical protein
LSHGYLYEIGRYYWLSLARTNGKKKESSKNSKKPGLTALFICRSFISGTFFSFPSRIFQYSKQHKGTKFHLLRLESAPKECADDVSEFSHCLSYFLFYFFEQFCCFCMAITPLVSFTYDGMEFPRARVGLDTKEFIWCTNQSRWRKIQLHDKITEGKGRDVGSNRILEACGCSSRNMPLLLLWLWLLDLTRLTRREGYFFRSIWRFIFVRFGFLYMQLEHMICL